MTDSHCVLYALVAMQLVDGWEVNTHHHKTTCQSVPNCVQGSLFDFDFDKQLMGSALQLLYRTV